MKKYIPIILGTGREGRQSEKVAKYVYEVLKEKEDIEVELIDCLDYIHGRTIPDWQNDDATKPWRDLTARADAFIIVSPEYNHGYPGELKMLLDQDLKNYENKPVGLCAVSSGGFGGTRLVENLVPVLWYFGMRKGDIIYFPKVSETFDKTKAELDEMYKEKILKMGENLAK